MREKLAGSEQHNDDYRNLGERERLRSALQQGCDLPKCRNESIEHGFV